jgi:hypothetical protein
MRSIAVRDFASGADLSHDDPLKSRSAQNAPAAYRCRQKPLLNGNVIARRPRTCGESYTVDGSGQHCRIESPKIFTWLGSAENAANE